MSVNEIQQPTNIAYLARQIANKDYKEMPGGFAEVSGLPADDETVMPAAKPIGELGGKPSSEYTAQNPMAQSNQAAAESSCQGNTLH